MSRLLLSVLALVVIPAFAQAPAVPPAPDASAEPTVWKTIELEWEAVDKAVGYEIKLTPLTGGKAHVFEAGESHLSQQVPVGNYKLQIRARDRDGEFSPWSEPSDLEVAVKEIIPLSPTDKSQIEATGNGKQSVEFSWSPVDKIRIYTLKVWSEDKKDTPWVFTGRTTKKTLQVPPGRVYYWQVLFESANDVVYNQEPKTFSFTLQGTQLATPAVAPFQAGKDLNWKGSDETKLYKTKLYYRHLDETEWTPIKDAQSADNRLSTKGLKPGNYKFEVIAMAPRRLNSVPASVEFYIKPSLAELNKTMKFPIATLEDQPSHANQ